MKVYVVSPIFKNKISMHWATEETLVSFIINGKHYTKGESRTGSFRTKDFEEACRYLRNYYNGRIVESKMLLRKLEDNQSRALGIIERLKETESKG